MSTRLSYFQCQLCSFRGAAPVRYDYGKHKIYECPLCGLLFLHPRPTPEELAEIYDGEQYFQHDSFYDGANENIYGYADYFAERMNKQEEYEIIVKHCQSALAGLGRAPELLEVGCGPGFFLSVAHQAGFAVRGIEFNRAIVESYGPKYPFPMEHCDFLEGECTPASYDCIVMLDVIEHFPDPFLAVERAVLMLRENGILVISTVDAGGIGSRLLGERLEDFRRVREHLFFFDRKNMAALLRREGLERIRAESRGHTFMVSHLADRIRLMSPAWGKLADLGARALTRAGINTLNINPRTKMLVYARKPATNSQQQARENIAEDLSLMASYRSYYDYYLGKAADYIKGRRVLELGCGTGTAMQSLLDMGASFVLGVDENEDSLARARKNLAHLPQESFSLFAADIETQWKNVEPLIRKHGVDMVLSFNFLEHLADDMDLIRRINAALAPGSLFVNVLPARSGLLNSFDEAYRHFRRYDKRDIKIRFGDFTPLMVLQVSPLKALGWKIAGRGSYRGLSSGLRFYNLASGLDRLLDRASADRNPLGASFICVHKKA